MKHYLEITKLKIRNFSESGYTLIEMLAVMFIISLLSGLTIYNYSVHKKDQILLTETQKIAQMFRRAQNLALSPQQSSVPGTTRNGYGVRVSAGVNAVTLFADESTGSTPSMYDGGTEKIEDLILNPEVAISVLQAPAGDGIATDESALNILYIPPDPVVAIYNGSANTNATDALIVIKLTSDPNKSRAIKINSVGLVEMK